MRKIGVIEQGGNGELRESLKSKELNYLEQKRISGFYLIFLNNFFFEFKCQANLAVASL